MASQMAFIPGGIKAHIITHFGMTLLSQRPVCKTYKITSSICRKHGIVIFLGEKKKKEERAFCHEKFLAVETRH